VPPARKQARQQLALPSDYPRNRTKLRGGARGGLPGCACWGRVSPTALKAVRSWRRSTRCQHTNALETRPHAQLMSSQPPRYPASRLRFSAFSSALAHNTTYSR
jgi:hypothetical protein